MRVIVVTPPAPVLAWADADAHLKLDGAEDQQVEVEAMIAAATEHLDGPFGWLGRAIGAQTLEARFDCFDANGMMLPLPPVIELVSVTYLDRDNVEQPLDLADCELFDRELVPAHGRRWPRSLDRSESVRVRYRAGFETVPAPVRAAILLMVGDLYRNRETVTGGQVSAIPMSTNVVNLLTPYRVWA
ncbi:head-tail connector protein [Sphingomonas koreensis]